MGDCSKFQLLNFHVKWLTITHLIHHNQALFFWTSCKKRKNLHGGHGTRMFICHKITRVLFLDVTVDTFYIALDNYTSNIIFH